MNFNLTAQQKEQFVQDGYVVMRRVIPLELINQANRAIDDILDKAYKGEYGTTFKWINREEKIPAFINDLLTPQKYTPVFGEMLNQVFLPYAEKLLGKPVRNTWLLLLAGGSENPYSASLHRDNSKLGGPDEAEKLKEHNMNLCYFQATLLPNDHFLQVIPKSHLRVATPEEKAISATVQGSIAVPDLVTIQMEPGDLIFRQTSLIHQGWNPEGKIRRTLVSGLWADHMPIQEIEINDYKILSQDGFVEKLTGLCKTRVQRYLSRYEEQFELMNK